MYPPPCALACEAKLFSVRCEKFSPKSLEVSEIIPIFATSKILTVARSKPPTKRHFLCPYR